MIPMLNHPTNDWTRHCPSLPSSFIVSDKCKSQNVLHVISNIESKKSKESDDYFPKEKTIYDEDYYYQSDINGKMNSRIMTTATPCNPMANGGTTPSSILSNDIVENKNRYRTNDIGHESPRHQNGNAIVNANMTSNNSTCTNTTRKSTLHNSSRVTKDDSLHSINSEASSTVGSDRKGKIINGAKHASLKRVSFGSSKGSMVETLVYETPVQEEPEHNHFMDHNGRLPSPMIPVPDTDEGREKVRVAFLGPTPSPATPGVLLLEPLLPNSGHLIDGMSASPAELLTTHTEHTSPAYHAQISTDSGWDNPFRPDGDLSREADEIVELIKGGKPITPTPGQNAPALPGCETTNKINDNDNHDSSTRPLLNSTSNSTTNRQISSDGNRLNQGNGNAHSGTPGKGGNINSSNKQQQQPVNEKIGQSNTATVEVGRVTAQGPGDASQVEHVTLKKKPKCKCCVLQ